MDEPSSDATVLVNGELVLVHYRSSYMSRLIQSDEQLKDYYSVIKNALLSFGGVKSRISWSGESFNKGRINCAKVNVKGRSLTVALALNPEDYEGTKYYFKDVSDKPKYDKVPMLIKVRSDRSLKYALELIEDMMTKLGIEFESESLVDYTMPYESTESLVARELIKVILPSGMTLDDKANIVKMDVAKLIEDSKDADDESDELDADAEE
jgi:predicted transport protein